MATPHITQQQILAGQFAVGAWVPIPDSAPGGNFLVTFIAHASSTIARPKWFVKSSEVGGGDVGYYEPVRNEEAALVPPVATGTQYDAIDEWGIVVAAGQTLTFRVPFSKEENGLHGLPFIRLGVGDFEETHPSTVIVTVVMGVK